MIGIIIGSFWVFLITLIIVMGIVNEMMTLYVFIFLLVIDIIGLAMIIFNVGLIIKKNKINKYGKICFGAVNGIKPLSEKYDDIYKIVFKIFNSEKNIYEDIEKVSDKEKYPINSFVIGKCYNNKVYIQKIVPSSEIPEDIRICLLPTQEQIYNMKIEMSLDKEYIFIGKTKYKRV
jgi:hypothetical protein